MPITNKDVGIMMKLALEYNASVIALATYYYGNMDSRPAQKSFRSQLMRIEKEYKKTLDELFGDIGESND